MRAIIKSLLAASVFIMCAQAHATSFYNGIAIHPLGNFAKSIVSSTSLSSEWWAVSALDNLSVLLEDGTQAATDADYCERLWSGRDPLNINCLSVAYDYSVHEGCPYCSDGWTDVIRIYPLADYLHEYPQKCKYFDDPEP